MIVEVLGNVQDGGVPHLGCSCEVCENARNDPCDEKFVSSLLLRKDGEEDSVRYLFDATPDIRHQIKGDYLDGIFVSHGHMGHILGLMYLGTESLDASNVPVYCAEDMEDFLMQNDPYRLLVDRNQIEIVGVKDGRETDILGGKVEPLTVDHSHVNTETLGFMIRGEEKDLFYISDFDNWTNDLLDAIEEADIAIIDGTFWAEDEIDRYDEVPHPTIPGSMEKTSEFDTEIYFTHLNHTNPALREDSEERKEVEEKGYGVVEPGMEFEI
jgi:pyrroloquinoline quinone biosynthesis protein B